MTAASPGLDRHLAEMRRLHRAPEPDVLAELIPDARLGGEERSRVEDRALSLLADLKRAEGEGWINNFLHEYRLNTEEGVALLALAEAFLRVPDDRTANLLIADKLGTADWDAHRGKSESGLVNSATWGLVVTRALMQEDERRGPLRQLIRRSGEPFVRTAVTAAMRIMGQVFVMGRTIDEAIARMEKPEHEGFTASFDMLGEAAHTYEDAERYYNAYAEALSAIGTGGHPQHSISVKLSALHPRYETAQAPRCVPDLVEKIRALASKAAEAGVFLTVDAEESDRLKISLDVIEAVARDPATRDWAGLGMAVQAYAKRARPVIAWANELGAETGRSIGVRLVKGAYWDSEIKWTQQEGLADYPLFTRKPATDVSYLACAKDLLAARHIRAAFASHNALTVATILEWAGKRRDFEFQRLHGMGGGLYENLVREEGYSCRIYAPVGGHSDLLAYLVRRLLENGANSSFVHQLADDKVTPEQLLADPVERIEEVGGTRHPAIPLPIDLYAPNRSNSVGIDLSDSVALAETVAAVQTASDIGEAPAEAGKADVAAMIETAVSAAEDWSRTPVEIRAAALERLADSLQREMVPLMALCVHEAKKTYQDAVAEVREAIDFCRYYAYRAREDFREVELPGPTGELNVLRLDGRGVFGCIAPWNFPLAIFTGQVAAALVAGNAVIAKPAPQTPRIARRAVELAHEAGIPKHVLHLAVGGAEPGQALVADPRVTGLAFTGSTATAKAIQRTLAENETRPIVPLIAETGGLNAMIVDSTALPEQVVTDVVSSAFLSAGQRCSALRLLLLQEEIYDRTIRMLTGAMDTLVIGDPADPLTDIGPVIDETARVKLETYRQTCRERWVHTIRVPTGDTYVAPTLIRLEAPEDLQREWFGPLLHVTTWKQGRLEETVERVNAHGFGLTMGLHSRIAGVAERVAVAAKVGNLYVNRNQVGAVVGSQPFGGERLSGTGPKAGGPYYLPRFAVERTLTIDTTSAGGNASLLSIEAT